MNKTLDQAMQVWIGAVKSLAFRMEEAEIDVGNQDTILAITMRYWPRVIP